LPATPAFLARLILCQVQVDAPAQRCVDASAAPAKADEGRTGFFVKSGMTAILLAASVVFGDAGFSAAQSQHQAQTNQQQQSVPSAPVPNAPVPQTAPPLSTVSGPITPGQGTTAPQTSSSGDNSVPTPPAPAQPALAPAAAPSGVPDQQQGPPPESSEQDLGRLVIHVNFVTVPTLVKDSKGKQVAGLTYRDFQVYENGAPQHISYFSTSPQPLSIAYVIDQSLPGNVMDKVNTSLGAIQGSLTPYDSAAVFTYANGAREWTGFTAGQSARLPAVLALAQASGSDPQVPINGGPISSGCSIMQNGWCVDPNVQRGGSAGDSTFITIPKEIHTLNDAILAAAQQLSVLPKERRKVIYVISDGKEYGSRATWKEVVEYLQHYNIAVYGTLVGESAEWGVGFIDRFHLPFSMYDNVLYRYTVATGGDLDTETGTAGIENSYQKIAAEARNQYTIGYYSHTSIYDSRFRHIEVRVDRPNLNVIAKNGYYPSGQDYR
jgi:VWFA-related protein